MERLDVLATGKEGLGQVKFVVLSAAITVSEDL